MQLYLALKHRSLLPAHNGNPALADAIPGSRTSHIYFMIPIASFSLGAAFLGSSVHITLVYAGRLPPKSSPVNRSETDGVDIMKTTIGALAVAVALIAGIGGASAMPTDDTPFDFDSVFESKN